MADKKKILVVDDEPDVRTFISTVLGDEGYETETAEDGVQALLKLEAAPPDLITLDITMPNKSGVKFYRDVKENDAYKAIPVIMVTGVTEDFKKFISSRRQVPPPEDYMAKPIAAADLIENVKKLLG